MIAKKEGDWYPKGLKEKDFRGLYGYQVFLAIAVFMGDGLYNLAKIGFVSARAYADQRRELAEAMAKILLDPDLGKQFGLAGKQMATERFASEPTVASLRMLVEGSLNLPPVNNLRKR